MTPPLFRLARPASATTNVLKTLVQVAIVWAFALGLLPAVVVRIEAGLGIHHWTGPASRWIGAVVFLAGSSCGLWSAWLMAVRGEGTPVPFDAARELVVEGPYRIIRNPMAVSAINQTIGVAIAVGSLGVFGLGLGGGILWHVWIRPPEERFLVGQFGEAYEAYRRHVQCWIPTWPPYRHA